nr:3C [Tortoise rafivirus A]
NGEFPHEIFNAIDKATFPLMAESYECRTTQSFMGIMDDMYVMNKHTWDAACSFVMRGKSYQKDEIPSWSAPNSDLLYFCLKDQTKVRNMTKFFLPPPPATKFKMNLLSKMYHASHDIFNLDLIDAKIVPATNFRMMPAKRVQIASGEIRVIYNTFSYDTNSYPGMCGSPVVLMNPAGPKIIGTHISGLAGRMGSAEALDATWRTAFVALHPEYGQ